MKLEGRTLHGNQLSTFARNRVGGPLEGGWTQQDGVRQWFHFYCKNVKRLGSFQFAGSIGWIDPFSGATQRGRGDLHFRRFVSRLGLPFCLRFGFDGEL
eukprot:s2313_g14.t1